MNNDRIPDPVGIMESNIERQISLIDKEDKYPCADCGKRERYEDMIPVGASPDSPLICSDCTYNRWPEP